MHLSETLALYEKTLRQSHAARLKAARTGNLEALSGSSFVQERDTYNDLLRSILPPEGIVLDAGSGPTEELREVIPDATVIYADRHAPPSGGLIADAGRLPFADRAFDAVFARNLLLMSLEAETRTRIIREFVRVTREQKIILAWCLATAEELRMIVGDISERMEDEGIPADAHRVFLAETHFRLVGGDLQFALPTLLLTAERHSRQCPEAPRHSPLRGEHG